MRYTSLFCRYIEDKKNRDAMKVISALTLSQELGIPAFCVKENGEILDLFDENTRQVSQEEVAANKFSFSANEKIEYVKTAMGFSKSESMKKETEQKLKELQQEKNTDIVANQENRTRNKSSADNTLDLLDPKAGNIGITIGNEISAGKISPEATTEELLQYFEKEKGISPKGLEFMSRILAGVSTAAEAVGFLQKKKLAREEFIKKVSGQPTSR